MSSIATEPPKTRLPFFDVLRGIALLAMTIYHFTWDLEFYGWILPGTTLEPGWASFARSIASSFLFLVGISLVLAHGTSIRWRGFMKRLLQIMAAAALITLATYVAFPQSFIFFGILHAIAVFSLIGLVFVRLHWAYALIASIAVFAVWQTARIDLFQNPLFWWIGLVPEPPLSNDYVPGVHGLARLCSVWQQPKLLFESICWRFWGKVIYPKHCRGR